MHKIIWTNGRWEIDSTGIIWLCSDVINRRVDVPAYIFKVRDKLIKT